MRQRGQKIVRKAACVRILLTAGILLLLAGPIIVNAAPSAPPKSGMAISPPTFELSANPGDTLKNSLRVDNLVQEALEVTVEARNFTALGEDGGVDLSSEDSKHALASWISVTPSAVTIPVGQSHVFEYTIKVPADAMPGGHFGSIIFKTTLKSLSGQTGVAVGQEVGALVFLKVAGEVHEQASIASFSAAKGLNDHGPVEFNLRVQNEGNVQFKPRGTITITDFFGKKVATVPVNEQNVLPGAIRKMTTSWNDYWLIGKYTATVSLVYGGKNQVLTASTTFWGFPYTLFLIVIAVAGIAFALIYPRRKRIKLALKVLFGK